jgi:response regulator RpfG family c-di-GMP phosphodiesterase
MTTESAILFVDDDPLILAGFQRTLRKQFTIRTANNGAEAIKIVHEDKNISVIIADMNMPQMDGITLLKNIKSVNPNIVRVMLTGAHDQGTAMSAINGGQIFRFITKPCDSALVERVIHDALEQYQLITAEKNLLEQTLHGAIHLLTDILAFVNPDNFGRLERLRGDIRRLCTAMQVSKAWEVEVATMLSPIGRTALPSSVQQKADSGTPLDPVEADLIMRVPETGSMLLVNIPRLENVSNIVLYQNKRFDGGGFPLGSIAGERIPIGARILCFLLALDRLEKTGLSRARAISQLQQDIGAFDPAVISAAIICLPGRDGNTERPVIEVTIDKLRAGHVLRRDLCATDGRVLLTVGQVITQSMIGLLAGHLRLGTIHQPLLVEEIPL